jgi:hypothetical protein
VKAEALMQRYKRFRFLVLCFISQRYLYSESKKKKTQEKKRGYPLSFSCFFFIFDATIVPRPANYPQLN